MKRFLLMTLLACMLLVAIQPASAQCVTQCGGGGNLGTAVSSIPTQATKPINDLVEYSLVLVVFAIIDSFK